MFEEQIAKGVEYLDKDLGQAWVDWIDLRELDLSDGHYCVIGQCYGHYSYHPQFEDGDTSLGFDLPTEENGLMKYSHYDVLTQEWKDTIIQLKAERLNEHV